MYGDAGLQEYGLSKLLLHQERSGQGAEMETQTLTLNLSYRDLNQGDLFHPKEEKH